MELHFSANDGRTWTLAGNELEFSQKVRWIVPHLTTKHARLKIVALTKDSQGDIREILLAMSPPFMVDTIKPSSAPPR